MSKTMKQPLVRTYRKFDESFKRQAVSNWLSGSKSAALIAQELGLSANLLYGWRKRFAPDDARRAAAKPGSPADLQWQLDDAQRELARVREQRDILKKTLGILSDPQPNATNGSTQ